MICRQAEELERLQSAHTLCDYRSHHVSEIYQKIRAMAQETLARHTGSCAVCEAIRRDEERKR